MKKITYTEILIKYLKGRRNIRKKAFKIMNSACGRMTWERFEKHLDNKENKLIRKIKYKVTKDEDFIGKRFESYTVEKIITYKNGEMEHLYRVVFPHIDGDINKIDFNKLVFQKPITQEEWEQLSQEYRTAWLRGTMTEELSKELYELRKKAGVSNAF